jgi:hypothetical protein
MVWATLDGINSPEGDDVPNRWQRYRAPVIAGLVLAALTAGCFLPGDDTTGQPAPDSTATGQSLEGAFTYEQMDAYVDAVAPLLTSWAEATWPDLPQPQLVYVPRGASGPQACLTPNGGPGRSSSASFEYCPADQTIYVGQDTLWLFYNESGDAGPAVGMAHEWGHHVQSLVGVPLPRTARHSVAFENQADCLSGAWTRYTDAQGRLEYPDDIEDIETLLPMIASAEGPDRDHGTLEERARSFDRGFSGDVAACNAYFPETPLAG